MFHDINSTYGQNSHTAKDTQEFQDFPSIFDAWVNPKAHPEIKKEYEVLMQKAKLVWGERFRFFKPTRVKLYQSNNFGIVVGANHCPGKTICMTASGHEFFPVTEWGIKDTGCNNPNNIFGGCSGSSDARNHVTVIVDEITVIGD